MTILERLFEDYPSYFHLRDRIVEYECPSKYYDIPDINGCDRFDPDRCVRCWNREYKED